MRALPYLGLVALTGLVACGGDEPAPYVEPIKPDLEIIGTWESQFGGDEVITKTTWTGADIRAYSNTDNFAIVQNTASDMFQPNKFAKYVWTEPSEGNFYYCIVDFGLDTQAAAEATTKTADATTPDVSGCSGFSWTKLLTPIEVRGSYTSNFGTMETITSTAWGGTPLRKFSNTANFAVTQNGADSAFGANLYNKIVWTEPASGTFYYCFVDFGRPTLIAAETSTKTADATSPDTAGCGGFSWTKLAR